MKTVKPYARHVPEPKDIPQALIDLPHWVVWKLKPKPGGRKPDKVPHSANPEKLHSAKWSNQDFATTFDNCYNLLMSNDGKQYHGLGILPPPGAGLACGDLDDCINPETGEIIPEALEILQAANTYTEISPGGSGFRFFAFGTFGERNSYEAKKPSGLGIELYNSAGNRFLTFTGRHWKGSPLSVEQRDLTQLATKHTAKKKPKGATVPSATATSANHCERGYTLAQVLPYLPNNGDSYDTWLNVGMAIKSEGGSYADWLEYSSRSDKHSEADMPTKWNSFAGSPVARGVSLGTLVNMAKSNGLPTLAELRAQSPDLSSVTFTPPQTAPADPFTGVSVVDIFGNLAPSAFPAELLPEVIGRFAMDQGELMGVDPAVIGMSALAALAGCIDDRLKIQPKQYDPTWTESARLWIGVIGEPSAKKSPGIGKALAPVKKVAAKWREQYQRELAKWQDECEQLKAADKQARLPEAPQLRRLTASDVTTEKLGDILSQMEPRGILIERDELSGWLSSMDAYRNGAGGKDKAAWLEAYNGGPKEIDRVNRGSIWVLNWGVSVVGGIQPSVIQSYANTTDHDGMLQRFLLVNACPAQPGLDRWPDMDAKQAYTDLIEHAAALQVHGGDMSVTLSPDAQEVRKAFSEKVNAVVVAHPNKHLAAALGKWEGVFARLALVYHVAECAQVKKHPLDVQVSGEAAQAVASLMWRGVLPHTIGFYEKMDSIGDCANALAGLLLARGWDRFTVKRDLNNNMHTFRKMKEWERGEMLDRLEAFGWIAPDPGKLNERGRPAAYLVNPEIHSRFFERAEIERKRREHVSALMGELREKNKM